MDNLGEHKAANLEKLALQVCSQHTDEGLADAKSLLANEVNSMSRDELKTAQTMMQTWNEEDLQKMKADARANHIPQPIGAFYHEYEPAVSYKPIMKFLSDRDDRIVGLAFSGSCETYVRYEPKTVKSEQ